MTVRRILFRGNVTLCSRYLPFAKDKLKTLSRTYSGRHSWTWERKFSGVTVSLEKNGPIEYIRIKAGILGYEFISVIAPEFLPPGEQTSAFTIADDLATGFVAKNKNGTRLTPENAGRRIDTLDQWLFARKYGPDDDEENDTDLGLFIYPVQEWFEIAVPLDDDEALLLADGAPRLRMLHWRGFRTRNVDIALWHNSFLPPTASAGMVFAITAGARARLTGLSAANSAEAPDTTGHFPRAAGSAYQGEFTVAASWRGDDFKFEARKENYQEYGTDSTFFTLTPPAWVFGDVWSPWYWRGDGRRCVSLQYGKTPGPPYDEQTVDDYDDDIDAGYVEAEIDITPGALDQIDEAPFVAGGFVNEQHNLGSLAIHPVGIDYLLLDQRKKRAYYFLQYMGPIRVDSTYTIDPGGTFTRYARDLLIYLVCAEIDDFFPGTEIWRMPVWHGQGWSGTDQFDYDGGINQRNADGDVHTNSHVIGGIGWGSNIGYPSLGEDMTDSAGNAIHPYRRVRAVVSAIDPRAEAIAMHYEVTIEDGTAIGGDVPHYGKYWRIWGEERQSTWITPDTATGSSGPTYDWLNTDPSVWEEADPPEPDPTVPPANFLSYLSSVPAGYVLFTKGHAYDFFNVQTGLQNIMATIVPQMVYLTGGGGSPYRNYNGFRIAPDKSFAVSVPTRPYFKFFSQAFGIPPNDYGVPEEWWAIDHIEKNKGPGEEPLTTTHSELYNSSRGVDLSFQTRPNNLNAPCVAGLWVD